MHLKKKDIVLQIEYLKILQICLKLLNKIKNKKIFNNLTNYMIMIYQMKFSKISLIKINKIILKNYSKDNDSEFSKDF